MTVIENAEIKVIDITSNAETIFIPFSFLFILAFAFARKFTFVNFIAKLRRLDDSAFAERYADITRRFGLAAVVNQRIETLSKGFRHRTAIAAALLSKPQILILDEPTEGLDPNQKHEFRAFLKDYGKSNLVVVSTHIMEEVEALATRVIMMNKGKIIKDTTAFDLKNFAQSGNMEDAFRRIINQ